MTDVSRTPPPAALTRRGFVSLGIGALAVASLPVAMYRRRQVTRRSLPVMGTIADLVVVSSATGVAQGALDAAMLELRRVEALMTRFRPDSDIGRVNAAPAGRAVPVTPETARVIAEALSWAETSNGSFDPAVGSAIRLWDVGHRHEPPAPVLVAALAGRQLYRQIEVGRSGGRDVIVRHDGDAQIDLGGIAKGYGVDRAATVLREWGIGNAVVDVGGDLVAIGSGVDGDGWRVGVQSPNSPDDPTDIALVLTVADAAIATSGTYAQFFTYKGRRYHHLLDPSVAAPKATFVQSFTVRADSCMHADVAATTCYGMPGGESSIILGRRAPGSRVVSTI